MATAMKPRLLDLFCGAGGAAVGYHRAGFEVVGVDIADQPNYPFEFKQGDALGLLDGLLSPISFVWDKGLDDFDAIHASPPCQAYTSMNRKHEQADTRAAHPALIAPTRELLQATGLPYVIENVPQAVAQLRNPIQLCGRALGVGLHRHRLFEANFSLMGIKHVPARDPFAVYGKLDGRRLWDRADGTQLRAAHDLDEARELMGIDWTTWDELREAIPPAYTEHIGGYLMAHLQAQEVAA